MQDLISVIVPVFNVEKYVAICINSILSQTYNNLEIIIVNDGSTDNSGKVCEQISLNDKRIKLFNKENGGLSSARNYGVTKALGKYFVFVDSDDWIKETMIEDLYNALKKHNVKIACCGRVNYKNENDFEKIGISEGCLLSSEQAIRMAAFNKDVGIAAWGKIYAREVFETIRFPEGEIHEDVAIMYKLFHESQNIYVLGEYEYYYRYNNDGISKSNYSEKFKPVLRHDIENEIFIRENYTNLESFIQSVTANSCICMMMKIAKTPNGCLTYVKDFNEYKKEFKKRMKYYFKFRKIRLKEFIWLIVLFSINSKNINIYRKIGLIE